MQLPTNFSDFLRNIRPTEAQDKDAAAAQNLLRERLTGDGDLSRDIVTTFLQGSYRRATDIKPVGDKKSDVDVIVVTRLHEDQFQPEAALEHFRAFLEMHYAGAYEEQGRSWGLIDGDVELDLVPTSAPSEAVIKSLATLRESGLATKAGLEAYADLRKLASLRENDAWRLEPLRIPDRDRKVWEDTHPIAQMDWTTSKNDSTAGRYVDIVRCFKWWRTNSSPGTHPKGYPLEAIVGSVCPDEVGSIADGFVSCCEGIVRKYKDDFDNGRRPFLPDHGVPSHNVLARLDEVTFANFYRAIVDLGSAARAALDDQNRASSVTAWRAIFGPEFPGDDGDGEQYFTSPKAPAIVGPRLFA